jgi:hypothetical protein
MRSARGSFTLSLDCEGLWRIADNRTIFSKGLINDESLKLAYNYFLFVLGKYSINATLLSFLRLPSIAARCTIRLS